MRAGAKVIGALWALQVANYMDRTAIAFVGPAIMADLKMGPQSLGLILSAFNIGYTVAQIPGGWIADRRNVRGLLALSALLWAAFTGITGLMSTMLGFIGARVALGAAEGIANSGLFRAIGDNFKARGRTGVIAALGTAPALGQAVAAPLIGLTVAGHGWPAVFALLTVPPVIAAALVYKWIPARDRGADRDGGNIDQEHQTRIGLPGLLRLSSLWTIALVSLFFSVAFWGYNGWMPTYLASAHQLDMKHLGLLGSLPYLASLVAVVLVGCTGMALHSLRPQIVAFCYVATAASLYLAFTAVTLPGTVAGLCGTSFFLHGSIAPMGSLMLDFAPPADRALFVGITHTSGQIGGIVAPALIGFLVHRTGSFGPGFTFMELALLAGAVGVLLLLLQPSWRRRHDQVDVAFA